MPDLVVRRVWSAFVRYRRLPVGPDSGRITYMCGHVYIAKPEFATLHTIMISNVIYTRAFRFL